MGMSEGRRTGVFSCFNADVSIYFISTHIPVYTHTHTVYILSLGVSTWPVAEVISHGP